MDQSWISGRPVPGLPGPGGEESWHQGLHGGPLFSDPGSIDLEAAVSVSATTNAPDLDTHILALASTVSTATAPAAELSTGITMAAAVTASARGILDSVPLRAAVIASAPKAWLDSAPMRAAVTVSGQPATVDLNTAIRLSANVRATAVATFGNLEVRVTATAIASLTTAIPLVPVAVQIAATAQLYTYSFVAGVAAQATATASLTTGIVMEGQASATVGAGLTPGPAFRANVECAINPLAPAPTGPGLIFDLATLQWHDGRPFQFLTSSTDTKHWYGARPVGGLSVGFTHAPPIVMVPVTAILNTRIALAGAVIARATASVPFVGTAVTFAAAVQCAAIIAESRLRTEYITRIIGNMYLSTGMLVTTGNLQITPEHFILLGTRLSAPPATVYVIPGDGELNIPMVPSQTVRYRVEYDPTPLDTSVPIRLKPGYWLDKWYVPDIDLIDIRYISDVTPPSLGPPPGE